MEKVVAFVKLIHKWQTLDTYSLVLKGVDGGNSGDRQSLVRSRSCVAARLLRKNPRSSLGLSRFPTFAAMYQVSRPGLEPGA
jgi:hypothetical protein